MKTGRQPCIMEYKCGECGRKFRDAANLRRHTGRARKCVVTDLTDIQKAEPTRCTRCLKGFSTVGNRNKHMALCKIEPAMPPPVVNVDTRLQDMEALIQGMRAEIEALKARTDGHDNNVGIVVNVEICNNFLAPSLDHITDAMFLQIYKDQRICTPLALLSHIWANPNVPCNHSLYVANKKLNTIQVMEDGVWITKPINVVSVQMRDYLYGVTLIRLDTRKYSTDDTPVDNVALRILGNRDDREVAADELQLIRRHLIDCRNVTGDPTGRRLAHVAS